MSEILTIPLKKASDVDLEGPLIKWVTKTYGSDRETIESAIKSIVDLNKMRKYAIESIERPDQALLANANYYDQLCLLDENLDFDELSINFKWKDAFEKGRKSALTKGKLSLTLPSFNYEKCSILFNIGALNSCVAATQDLESSTGLQQALKFLQTSAGIFEYLNEKKEAAFKKDTIMDNWTETLDFLTNLTLAQAQEIVIFKAISENMKNAVIAKLSSQCELMYENLKKVMIDHVVKRFFPLEWRSIISQKHFYYGGLAQFHQSRICHESSSRIGEEIARLKLATERFSNVTVLGSKFPYKIKEWKTITEDSLAIASKDNDCIYSEKIPNEEDLFSIENILVAKVALVNNPLGNPNAPNLFHMLFPTAVLQAIKDFDQNVKSLKVKESDRLREATVSLNQTLSSLNLPAALEDSGSHELPESLRHKSLAIQEGGGVKYLKGAQENLATILGEINFVLNNCLKSLTDKISEEKALREEYKNDWIRSSSDQIENYRIPIEEYRRVLEKASLMDKLVGEKIETHLVFLDMLMKGPNHLTKAAPSCKEAITFTQMPVVEEIMRQMTEVDIIKEERASLQSKINDINPDMKIIFKKAYSETGFIKEELPREILVTIFSNIQKDIESNLNHQNRLISKIRANHDELSRKNVFGSSAREEMFRQLATAHDAFFEIKGHLEADTIFYNDLHESVIVFQNTVNDFFMALDIEKEELIDEIQSSDFHDAKSDI